MEHSEQILILDFGSQYTQLIARRIRESKVYSEIQQHNFPIEKIEALKPNGIILSGGPMSVYDKDAPAIDNKIFNLGVPILGICYGLQLIALGFNGKVESAHNREYGKTLIRLSHKSRFLSGLSDSSIVWMSHGDLVKRIPEDFLIDVSSENSPICAISNEEKKIYGLQFHPEVTHTAEGKK